MELRFLMIISAAIMTLIVFGASSMNDSPFKHTLDNGQITTAWNLSFLIQNEAEAVARFQELKQESEEINQTFRPLFRSLTGKTLLEWLEAEKNFSRSLEVLMSYAYAKNSLNVNDQFFEKLKADVQDLFTEHYRATSFAEVKLKSLSLQEWERIFRDEPGLEMYRAFLESNYLRYAEHRPREEAHVAILADISNERMKLETSATKEITNNVTVAGNVTLTDGREVVINSQTYSELISTDVDREDRKRVYDKRFYHLINQSDKMAEIYLQKSKLDDRLSRELNFTNSYQSKLFGDYLTKEQVEDMNSVFKERKRAFDGYLEFRRIKMGLDDQLMPYDLYLQMTKDPDKRYSYYESLSEIEQSLQGMDPRIQEIFFQTVTGNYIDVYPNPEGGKEPGGYCQSLCALQLPAIIFLNFKGLIDDKFTLAHELGHAINFYLMGQKVDYLYCGGTEYEMEIPSTFAEELLVDYIVANYDKETSEAVLAKQIGDYQNYFTFQPMITEFEDAAHKLCDGRDDVSGAELNSLWTALDKEYRSDKVRYYDDDSAQWTYITHIYFTNNYYTFSYALSKAVTLALFKRYREDPLEFNRNYIEYLSAGTSMTPPDKMKRYFGLEVNWALFEDAMDMVELRVRQLKELEERR